MGSCTGVLAMDRWRTRITLAFPGCLKPTAGLAVIGLMSACGGTPARMAPADPATVASLNQMRQHPCNPMVASTLAALDVPMSQIRDLAYTVQGTTTRTTTYTAWMPLQKQPGYLIVDLDTDGCRLMQAYTRGGASLPKVRSSIL
jgi:hypothetical protein